MVKVSVIVPVYNVYDYIDKCLFSIVKQTLKDKEVIVINDGSIDNSEEIIKKYTKLYPFIHYYKKENGGLSDARNYGISKANGEYLAFIDSDDYIEKDMLELMYNKAVSDDSDIVVCDTIDVCNDKNVLKRSNVHMSDDNVKNYIISPPMACIRLIRKKLFTKILFQKGIYYEDLELTPKLVLYTNKISFVEKGLYYYVIRNNSIMRQNSFNEKLFDIFKVLDSNKEKLYTKYPNEIEYMYITHLLRTATLRFLDYSNYLECVNKILDIFKKDFPRWHQNCYYKKSSFKMKVLCNLAYYKQFWLLKIIKKIWEA